MEVVVGQLEVLVVSAVIPINKATEFLAPIVNRKDTIRIHQVVDFSAVQVAVAHQDTVGCLERNDLQNTIYDGSFDSCTSKRSLTFM